MKMMPYIFKNMYSISNQFSFSFQWEIGATYQIDDCFWWDEKIETKSNLIIALLCKTELIILNNFIMYLSW